MRRGAYFLKNEEEKDKVCVWLHTAGARPCPAPGSCCALPPPWQARQPTLPNRLPWQVRSKLLIDGRLNADIVGQSAQKLAQIFGIEVPGERSRGSVQSSRGHAAAVAGCWLALLAPRRLALSRICPPPPPPCFSPPPCTPLLREDKVRVAPCPPPALAPTATKPAP